MSASPHLVSLLAAIVGTEHVLVDPTVTFGFEQDWLGRHAGTSSTVVRPADAVQVAAVLTACRDVGAAVVPQGGNTGLVGGGVPHAGEVVLSTLRLRAGYQLDEAAGQVTLPAGMTVGQAQQRLAAAGWELGVDLASRDSATIGGLVATNAGGLRVPRFGHVREQLVGVEAVLADGTRIRQMSGLLKDNTGYHLPGMLCGSEGTLAVVTAARLQVWPLARQRVTVVLAVPDLASSLTAVRQARKAMPTLECAELVFADGVERTLALGARRAFATQPACELLLECSDRTDAESGLLEEVLALLAVIDPADACVAEEADARTRLWERRERHPELVNRLGGVSVKLDTAVPLAQLPAYELRVRAAVAAADPDAALILFGHVADGNLHVNVATCPERVEEVRDAVFEAVQAHQGSLSAEHGIGWDKRHRLDWVRSADEIAAMRAIKRGLDPTGLLNPNAVFPAEVDALALCP